MRSFFVQPVLDLVSVLERLLGDAKHLARAIAVAMASLVVTWFIYVPIHELLHVTGCLVTGGSVTKLEIAPHYGGGLLARVLPFVVSGGEYAGRLSGFDTHGSDLTYLATDLGPFLLTVFPGVLLVKLCGRRYRPLLFGPAVVLGLAPFYNVIGDYYEMGSILATRALALVRGDAGPSAVAAIRSDDVFKLIGEVWTQAEPSASQWPGSRGAALVLVGVSFLVGVVLALATYALGAAVAKRILKRKPG